MEPEIRSAQKEEMVEFIRVATAALVLPHKLTPELASSIAPEITLCAFDGGKLATTSAALPLTMRFNGDSVPVSGITLVGTLPIYRKKGFLRRILTRHFELLYHQKRQPITALYASQAAIYQRFGYGIVSSRNTYKVVPQHLRFATGQDLPENASFKELGDDGNDVLRFIYRQFVADRIGYLHRAGKIWDIGALSKPKKGALLNRILYLENDTPLGYVIYTIEPQNVAFGQPWQRIDIRDIAWLTADAYQAIWNFFADMGVVTEINWAHVPSDDPLPHLLLEPRQLNIRSNDGLLARIVDLEAAISKRVYDYSAEIAFEVIDDICPWNNSRWAANITPGGTGIGKTKTLPEIIVPIDTLAMLLFGQISATQAGRMGRLGVIDYKALPKYDRLFATRYRPFCADIF
jgi:predicted acetyltransferase